MATSTLFITVVAVLGRLGRCDMDSDENPVSTTYIMPEALKPSHEKQFVCAYIHRMPAMRRPARLRSLFGDLLPLVANDKHHKAVFDWSCVSDWFWKSKE